MGLGCAGVVDLRAVFFLSQIVFFVGAEGSTGLDCEGAEALGLGCELDGAEGLDCAGVGSAVCVVVVVVGAVVVVVVGGEATAAAALSLRRRRAERGARVGAPTVTKAELIGVRCG